MRYKGKTTRNFLFRLPRVVVTSPIDLPDSIAHCAIDRVCVAGSSSAVQCPNGTLAFTPMVPEFPFTPDK